MIGKGGLKEGLMHVPSPVDLLMQNLVMVALLTEDAEEETVNTREDNPLQGTRA